MSNPVPSDKISDGKLNFGTADVMVNSDDHTVTTRTGKVIRTFAGINAEFDAAQAGQFVAASQDAADRAETAAEVAAAAGRVYETSAAGQADSELGEGDYFWVVSAEDSEVLELWRKGASSAADTGKRTVEKAYVDEVEKDLADLQAGITTKVEHDASDEDHLYSLVDKNGNIVARFRLDGQLDLVGLDESVQNAIVSIKRKIETQNIGGALFALLDANDNVVAKFEKDSSLSLVGGSIGGGDALYQQGVMTALVDSRDNIIAYFDDDAKMWLANMTLSVQDTISGLSPADESSTSTNLADSRFDDFFLSDDSIKIISNTSHQVGYKIAPYGAPVLPHGYTVPLSFIDELSLAQPAQRIIIDTPYFDDDQVAHPALLEFYNGFRGYRYWMAITPYQGTNDIYENPFVYGSNDLVNFELISGFDQPLAEKPDEPSGHNSDVGLTYNPKTGELICFWRKTVKHPSSVSSLWCRRTLDGRSWSDAEQIAPDLPYGTNAYLSPSYLYNPSDRMWHRYTVQDIAHIKHATARDFNGPWIDQPNIIMPASFNPWHLDVRWIGDKLVMIINDHITTEQLYLGISEDGYTWSFNETPLLVGDFLQPYKATFLPEFNASGELSLKVAWTSSQKPSDPNDKWRLFISNTNYISI